MGSDRKNTLPLKFKIPRINSLLALSNKITPCTRNNFVSRYGDFRLSLTNEEYERLLGWYLKDHPPFTNLGEELIPELVVEDLHLTITEVTSSLGPRGFSKQFLQEKAWTLEKEGIWLPFNVILALLSVLYSIPHLRDLRL
ncbi:hypothetical protein KIW84_070997 [Lathyrus oleraceus]|uniref:DUF7745 domain-containing protein n=1 Tax=Pisum sativum TaxID=3888 RepID=A0A9D4VJK3_PEA|nr:hypothetical protein KIW84_070997 [Pisum sativum]